MSAVLCVSFPWYAREGCNNRQMSTGVYEKGGNMKAFRFRRSARQCLVLGSKSVWHHVRSFKMQQQRISFFYRLLLHSIIIRYKYFKESYEYTVFIRIPPVDVWTRSGEEPPAIIDNNGKLFELILLLLFSGHKTLITKSRVQKIMQVYARRGELVDKIYNI